MRSVHPTTKSICLLHDGSTLTLPVHVSVMEYVIKVGDDDWVFGSWKGHNITRRNLLQFNGKSLDTNDIRYNEPNYRPLPNLKCCTDEEHEYLMQHLDRLLHNGGTIVGRYQPFL